MESTELLPSEAAIPAANQPHRFRALLQRALDGCADAARELHQKYGNHIIRAVRRRLPRTLRSKFDSIDFAQDVWLSFYRAAGREFESPEHLMAFLAVLAQNKVVDATRERLDALKHDTSREEPLAEQTDGQSGQQVFAREGTPSQMAISREMWEEMLADEPPAYRLVLTLLRNGGSQHEVAEQLKISRRTVQRILQRALAKTRV